MKKVIEQSGEFFVKEYNENGDSVAISEPFASEVEALAAIGEVEEEKPKRKAKKEVIDEE